MILRLEVNKDTVNVSSIFIVITFDITETPQLWQSVASFGKKKKNNRAENINTENIDTHKCSTYGPMQSVRGHATAAV